MTNPTLQRQSRAGKTTLLLDGRVVEFFHESTPGSTRYHVDHWAVESEAYEGGVKARFGIGLVGSITSGSRVTVPSDQVADFEAFVAEAAAARTLVTT